MAEEKKPFDQIKYQNEFNKNRYDRITVLVPKGKKSEWEQKAKAEGMSLTAYVISKVEGGKDMYPYEPMPTAEVIHTETIRGDEYKLVKTYIMGAPGEYHDNTGAIKSVGGAGAIYRVLKNGKRFLTRGTEAEGMAIIEEIRIG